MGTSAELDDLHDVAALLDLDPAEVDVALAGTEAAAAAEDPSGSSTATDGAAAGFALKPGDLVVFTGQMSEPREVWEARAAAAGLVPHRGATKKVSLVIAADPDSLSGKARKAVDYGIPIVTEEAFDRMVLAAAVDRR